MRIHRQTEVALAVAALVLGGVTGASGAAPDNTVRAPPEAPSMLWLRRPSGRDIARHYPDRAERLRRSGAVELRCSLTASGTLTACRVLSETPEGFGFGRAALELSRLFLVRPAPGETRSVEGVSVDLPLKFNIG